LAREQDRDEGCGWEAEVELTQKTIQSYSSLLHAALMLSNQSNPWSVWFISPEWKRFRVVECHGYTVSEKQVPPW